MFREDMPYWFWFCNQAKEVDHRQIGLGELFAALLDRLAAHGIETEGVSGGFANLADRLALPYDQGASGLLQAVEQVSDRFKEDVINAHTAYFRRDGRLEPIHLGYMAYCVHVLERVAALLRMQMSMPSIGLSTETVNFPPRMLKDLFDWYGDYDELEYYYWRQELNEIMGVGE